MEFLFQSPAALLLVRVAPAHLEARSQRKKHRLGEVAARKQKTETDRDRKGERFKSDRGLPWWLSVKESALPMAGDTKFGLVQKIHMNEQPASDPHRSEL